MSSAFLPTGQPFLWLLSFVPQSNDLYGPIPSHYLLEKEYSQAQHFCFCPRRGKKAGALAGARVE